MAPSVGARAVPQTRRGGPIVGWRARTGGLDLCHAQQVVLGLKGEVSLCRGFEMPLESSEGLVAIPGSRGRGVGGDVWNRDEKVN